MTNIFSDLLVSSPNGGGLFVLHQGASFRIDSLDTTGLWVHGRCLMRGLQPNRLRLYGEQQLDLQSLDLLLDDIHDVLEHESYIYVVGTTKNIVTKLNFQGEPLDRWQLPGEDDSAHVNCLTVWNGRLVFSSFGEFHANRGYKGHSRGNGCVHDLLSGEPIIRGLSQPHSPTPFGKNLLVANSEAQEICEFAPDGTLVRSKNLGGYTRGIYVRDGVIFIGLSSSRHEEQVGKTSSLVALDEGSWSELARLVLPTAEIYSITGWSPGLLGALLEAAEDSSQGLIDLTERFRELQVANQANIDQLVALRADLQLARRSIAERVWAAARKISDCLSCSKPLNGAG